MNRQGTYAAGAVRLLLCVLLAGSLMGCGSDPSTGDRAADPESSGESAGATSDTTSSAPADTAPADSPECAEIWQTGTTIPRSYQGCVEDDGTYTERDVLGCSSGQRMVRHADRFYGVLGGTAHETGTSLVDDPEYQDAVARCRA